MATRKKAERFKIGNVVRVAKTAGSPSDWRGREVVITTIDPATVNCEALYDVAHLGDASEVNFFDSELEPLERHRTGTADDVRVSIARKLRELADEIEAAI